MHSAASAWFRLPVTLAVILCVSCAAQNGAPAAGRSTDDLEAAINRVEASDPDRSTPAYRTNMPLAKLQLKKAELAAARRWGYYGESPAKMLEKGFAALDRLQAGTPYFAEKTVLDELAYVAENDGSVQPYYLHLPADYDPEKPWPLIVFLHGYVPTISVLDPWVLSEEVCQIAEDNGCILLIPYGRRNTDFQGVGEVDILAATEQVKSLYNIDPMRIHISGVSMGGMGTWNMALRHPGMYAAATPISGQTDMHTWWPRALPNWPASRDQIPPFRRFLVEWDNPIDLVPSARNQNIFVQHGEADNLIPVQQSRDMVEAARRLGINIKIHEFKGEGHYIYWDLPCFQNAWSWTKGFALDPSPRRITHKTYSLEYDTAYWLRIADFLRWGIPATVDCQVSGNGSGLRITCENVRLMEVDLATAPLKKAENFDIVVNGKRGTARVSAEGKLQITCADVQAPDAAWPPRKRKGLCGPVEEVFDGPFAVVIGTAGDENADRDNTQKALRWAEEWDSFADGVPRVKIDAEVSEEDIRQYNLVLFGTPASNSVLARMADRLPVTIGEGSYTLAGKTYTGTDIGLVFCYPNPLAPDRYVAVYSGELYGAKCGINHKHDLIPDFIVFDGKEFNYDDTNRHLVAGYFDMNWQLSPETTW